jgi:tRNA threonylcarbamoyladenosine biosynthesis protein TsaB
MKLLAVDTSTTSCSVALFDDQRLLAEIVYTAGQTHSRHLLSIIHRILETCEYKPLDIEGICVARGPGTFTGLRIGISTVKGLAAALRIPVVGVSSLAALAFPLSHVERPVVAMIDARREEVYHAQFRGTDGGIELVAPASVGTPDAVAAILPDDALLVGSGALLYKHVYETSSPSVRFADTVQHVIRAASVGMLAMPRFEGRHLDSIDTLIPEYIRKSDAQIQMPGAC